jgi:hypothetical protein
MTHQENILIKNTKTLKGEINMTRNNYIGILTKCHNLFKI